MRPATAFDASRISDSSSSLPVPASLVHCVREQRNRQVPLQCFARFATVFRTFSGHSRGGDCALVQCIRRQLVKNGSLECAKSQCQCCAPAAAHARPRSRSHQRRRVHLRGQMRRCPTGKQMKELKLIHPHSADLDVNVDADLTSSTSRHSPVACGC